MAGKYKQDKPLGRPRRRWDKNIKMDRKEIHRRTLNYFIWLSIATSAVIFLNIVIWNLISYVSRTTI